MSSCLYRGVPLYVLVVRQTYFTKSHTILSVPLCSSLSSKVPVERAVTLGDTLREKLRMMDSIPSDEETEQQRDSQFMGAASIISTDGG